MGIVFFRTTMLDDIEKFYIEQIGMSVWLKQKDCIILKHDNLLLGFCQREVSETEGLIAFVYSSKEDVDSMHRKLDRWVMSKPIENEQYEIYHFFAKDPEDRTLEFQVFLHPTSPL
ncbi:MAG: VOC family protein [Candidatus Thorarchaeota archaeon]|jgi:hypothetical protein